MDDAGAAQPNAKALFAQQRAMEQGDVRSGAQLAAPGAADVRVGLCGFTTSMHSYARNFPVVEVQSTFYEPPADTTMRKWLGITGPGLEYAIKVWQLVTHPASSPTYRRMKRKLGEHEMPGFFRDSPSVEGEWRRSTECAEVLSASARDHQEALSAFSYGWSTSIRQFGSTCQSGAGSLNRLEARAARRLRPM